MSYVHGLHVIRSLVTPALALKTNILFLNLLVYCALFLPTNLSSMPKVCRMYFFVTVKIEPLAMGEWGKFTSDERFL